MKVTNDGAGWLIVQVGTGTPTVLGPGESTTLRLTRTDTVTARPGKRPKGSA